jgi:hypothetical protein
MSRKVIALVLVLSMLLGLTGLYVYSKYFKIDNQTPAEDSIKPITPEEAGKLVDETYVTDAQLRYGEDIKYYDYAGTVSNTFINYLNSKEYDKAYQMIKESYKTEKGYTINDLKAKFRYEGEKYFAIASFEKLNGYYLIEGELVDFDYDRDVLDAEVPAPMPTTEAEQPTLTDVTDLSESETAVVDDVNTYEEQAPQIDEPIKPQTNSIAVSFTVYEGDILIPEAVDTTESKNIVDDMTRKVNKINIIGLDTLYNTYKIDTTGIDSINKAMKFAIALLPVINRDTQNNANEIKQYYQKNKDLVFDVYGINSEKNFMAFIERVKGINKVTSVIIDKDSTKTMDNVMYSNLIVSTGDSNMLLPFKLVAEQVGKEKIYYLFFK